MKISSVAALVLAAGLLLGGCGQKGALVLPDAPKHRHVLPVLRPPQAPAAPANKGPTPTPAPSGGGNATGPGPVAPTPIPPPDSVPTPPT